MSKTNDNPDGTALSEIWTETKEQLDDIDSEDPIASGELANEFIPNLAEAVHVGQANRTAAEPLLKQFARNVDIAKGVLDNKFEDELDRLEEEDEGDLEGDGDDSPPLTELLQHHLEKLVLYVPSDASADTRYNWVFDNGVEVETESEHRAPDSFAQAYHDASGGRRNARNPDIDGAWPEYMREFVKHLRNHEDEKVEVVPVEGTRTQVLEDLQNVIETTPATTDLQDASQQMRPFIVSPDADEVQVPSRVIERLLADFEDVSYTDLQIEMDKRGHRAGNVRATQTRQGTNVRLWRLNRDWLDVEVQEADTDGGNAGEVNE